MTEGYDVNPGPPWYRRFAPPALYVLSFMVFWGQIQNYMLRISLNLIIVAMAREPVRNVTDGTEYENPCLDNITSIASDSSQVEDDTLFDWDSFTRNLVLSANGYGYITTQIIGGRLAEKFG